MSAESLRVRQLFGERPVLCWAGDASFCGNLKYFYLYLLEQGANAWFVSADAATLALLQDAGLPASDEVTAAAMLAEARYVIVAEAGMAARFDAARLPGLHLVQLGSGSPLKRIGLTEAWSSPSTDDARRDWLEYHHAGYHAVVSASDWFSRISNMAWQAQAVLKTGYPAHEMLARPPVGAELLNCGVDYSELQALSGKMAIGCYLPTQREHVEPMLTSLQHDWAAFNDFLRARDIVLLVKPHARDAAGLGVLQGQDYSNLLPLPASADIYPLLGLCDFIISDYSSVSYDFLLLDRPQLFFVPDYTRYLAEDRGFIYDFPLMAPGPMCVTLDELGAALEQLQNGEDPFVLERAQINAIANECPAAGASARIVDDLAELASLQEAA